MANKVSKSRKLDKNLFKMYRFLAIFCILLEIVFVIACYLSVDKQIKTEAKAHAEEIVSSIQTELHQSYETTELLEDLYKVYGNLFLEDFNKICSELVKDNIAIGSMYFAPDGIIKYAYPDEVDSATSNFNMLKDPIQGHKAQKAINDRKPTIAGPHNLIESGEGFIVRNPIFDGDSFKAFSITVIDKETLKKQISTHLRTNDYMFAIWKDTDPTAVLDEDGFILTNFDKGTKISRDVQQTFNILNDTWHLVLEPKDGWNVWKAMRFPLGLSISILLALLILFYSHILAETRKRQLELEILASDAKSRFLFSMSHDIRTPMNAIIGFADLMKKNLDNKEKLADYLEKLHSSSNFLLSLINNVLEMASIESGKMILSENIISTQKFEDVTDAVFTDLAKDKGLAFSNEYHLINEYVIGDEMKIRELTLNIISNAIKYTPAGGFVKLTLEESKCDKPGYTLFTAIAEDSGIGISSDFLPHIFEEFSRERSSTESKIAGTGLGMPIVKKIIDMMDGTIDIQSEVGKGTKITIHLPLKIPTAEQIETAKLLEAQQSGNTSFITTENGISTKFNGRRILLAEDNNLNAEIAIALLEEQGFIVEQAVDGQKCVKMLEEKEPHYYDVILMDIQMPVMDGFEATSAIRILKDQAKANIPIIAMTANAFDEDRQKAFDAGMNAHVAKPIDATALLSALSGAIK